MKPPPMKPPPKWLAKIFAGAESLALDDEEDREELAERIIDGLPLTEMVRLGAETVRHQLKTRRIHIDEALALDVTRNAVQAMMGELLRLPGES